MILNHINEIYVLLGLLAILLIWIIRLEIKLHHLLIGSGSKNLDQSLASINKYLTGLIKFKEEEERYLIGVEKRLRRSLQATETVRFNPFKGTGTGGTQSFATSFLNEEGNGVVFSSLYAHDRMSIFSKPLVEFGSSFELTGEEKAVISKSKESLKS